MEKQKQQQQVDKLKEVKKNTKNDKLKQAIDDKLKYVNKPIAKQ